MKFVEEDHDLDLLDGPWTAGRMVPQQFHPRIVSCNIKQQQQRMQDAISITTTTTTNYYSTSHTHTTQQHVHNLFYVFVLHRPMRSNPPGNK